MDLASACRVFLPKWLNYLLYALAEIAIIATDLAEASLLSFPLPPLPAGLSADDSRQVIGTAIALNLLIPQLPLVAGCALSIVDVMIILIFYRPNGGMRELRAFEIFVCVLVLSVVICFCIQLSMIKAVAVREVFAGYLPSKAIVESQG